MEKKHISIIGSCISRHLFNTSILESAFIVDKYAYQICIWDLFGDKINIEKDELLKYYNEEFTARMITYDLTKCTLEELSLAKSEYLILDLYNIIENVLRFKIGDSTIYSQVSYDRYSLFLNNVQNIVKNNQIIYSKCSYKEIDENIILNGLKKLAVWIKKYFELNKVMIVIPSFASQYVDIEGKLYNYAESSYINFQNNLSVIKKYSLYLTNLLHGIKLLDLSDINSISQFNIYDNLARLTPPPMHYLDEFYIAWSKEILQLFNLNFEDFNELPISSISYECARYRNLYLKTLKGNKKQIFYEYNLNDYISMIEDLSDFVIIISAKDECSFSLKYFSNKSLLGINMDVKYRDAYIAIIDKSRNYIKEIVSENMISFEYKNNLPESSSIIIKSAGYNSGNLSSIILNKNNESIELSLNKRGLNFVLLNSKTLELVDQFRCDTHLDSSLKINSLYLSKVKIKI